MDTQYDAQKFEYVILPGKNCPRSSIDLYDKAFDFWLHFWTDVFIQNGSDEKPDPDTFFRQDFVPIITYEGQVAALHLYSIFDLLSKSIFSQSYLAGNFSVTYFEQIRKMQIGRVMTMESLSVHPDFRKRKVGFSLASLLGSLGQKVFSELTDCEAIICPARVDNKVTEIAAELGFQTIVSGVSLYNTPVDLILCRQSDIRQSENPVIQTMAAKLWREHQRFVLPQTINK